MLENIVSKNEILTAIENALLNGLWTLPGDPAASAADKDETRKTVRGFIEESLSRLGSHELLDRFDTPEKILDGYVAYLETKLEIGDATIH